jgi:membrane protein DedA with SNARE-associated domain
MLHRLIALIIRHGVPLVALNVFLEQIGVPIPAVPALVVAGALARDGKLSSIHLMAAAITASLAADYVWFLLGRRYGYRILRTLCRISLSPDTCVRDTEANFERWGMKSLLVAKFIPGFSTVAPPLAGATRRRTLEFLVYDAVGAAIWAGAAVAAGHVFHRAVDRVLVALENLGWWSVVGVISLLTLIIVVKWGQRRHFMRQLRIARISVSELHAMLERGTAPVILDVRTSSARGISGKRIPGALVASVDQIPHKLREVDLGSAIVLYCT